MEEKLLIKRQQIFVVFTEIEFYNNSKLKTKQSVSTFFITV